MYTVFYFGLDCKTPPLLLSDETIKLVGVAKLDFLTYFSINPINCLFALLYRSCEEKRRNSQSSRVLQGLCNLFKHFASGVMGRYSEYILSIASSDVTVYNCGNYDLLVRQVGKNLDLIVVNAWEMLPASILDWPKWGIINVHPSKLPKYRGALPTLWTLKNNDTETAVTYIKLEQSADVGKIIAQYNISIPKETTSLELEVLIANSVQKTLVVTILRYLDGSIQLINQDNSIASYTEKYNKYREIEIAKESLAEISNKVNLYPYLDPYVYCFVIVSGKKIEIKKVQYAGFSTKKSTFLVKGLRLYFISEMGSLYARLFLDISIMNSLFLLKSKRH